MFKKFKEMGERIENSTPNPIELEKDRKFNRSERESKNISQ